VSLENNHNDKLAQGLNNSFENWDAGAPSDSLWNKLNSSLENSNTATSMEEAFEQWDNPSPVASVWDKLNASLNKEVIENRTPSKQPQSLSTAFNEWNTDEPKDGWNKLDEELSTTAVWDKLSNSLNEEGDAVIDTKFKAAYHEWSTGTNHDGWTKLDDALSRERVWNKLSVSLTQPVGLSSVWWKYAASLIAFTFLSFFMSDQMQGTHLVRTEAQNHSNEIGTEVNGGNQTGNNPIAIIPNEANRKNRNENRFVANDLNPNVKTNLVDQNRENNNLANNSTNNANNSTTTTVESNVKNDDFVYDNLAFLYPKSFETADNCANVRRTHFYEPKRSYLSATFAFGTQLSQSKNDNRSTLSSSAPRLGLAVDLAVSRHFKHWGITQDFGYIQFTQLNGDFVKGRYQNSIQHLSTLQATTGAFYSFNRFDLNGGIVFTRILNGLEQEDNKIINVYNTNKIQTGINAGITYNISPRREKIRYGVGLQYQWTPNINAGTTVFRDVQGLKIQAKISF